MDQYLVEHCAPTLASIKSANLFTVTPKPGEDLDLWVAYWNHRFSGKGISIKVLRKSSKSALVYVYRPDRVKADLEKPGVWELLRPCGYPDCQVEQAVDYLKKRIADCEQFPHEIGLFLGYPAGDVRGFIQNKGKNCLCSGIWKVYCNECWAKKQFARYDKCREVYGKIFRQGRDLLQMTVAG